MFAIIELIHLIILSLNIYSHTELGSMYNLAKSFKSHNTKAGAFEQAYLEGKLSTEQLLTTGSEELLSTFSDILFRRLQNG